ncbi:uncharacterized protein LOC121853347 [Homarus americanus]|uniref:uncharacterized protein LOC121853347 n=1 Tax=Homarus americanus TaxID=6706 RepID=UPI001C44A7A8|nr:uncharacterized protein LOC121853347 [Homarus americanus]
MATAFPTGFAPIIITANNTGTNNNDFANVAAVTAAGASILTAIAVIFLIIFTSTTQTFRSGRFRRSRNRRDMLGDEDTRVNSLLELVRAQDVTGCGKKLVCELAAQPEDRLPDVARNVLNLVRSVVKPGEGLLPPGAAGEYLEAKNHGLLGLDCAQEYPVCPYDGQHLRNLMMTFRI